MPNTGSDAPTPQLPTASGRDSTVWRGWLSCFIVSILLYALTAQRGAQWQDSGYHILRIVTGEPVNPLGLALSHPLHHWIGRFVVGLDLVEPSFAVTLISALFGAIAVANTFGCVWTLTRSVPAALLSAMSLAFAHTFWRMSTLAETYTLAGAILAGECWLVVLLATRRRGAYWVWAMFLNGLGISNHLLALLTTPVLIWLGVGSSKFGVRSSKKLLVGGVSLWVVGASLYFWMIASEGLRGEDWISTLNSALFGHGYRSDVLNVHVSAHSLGMGALYLLLNFPNLIVPVGIFGLVVGEAARPFKTFAVAGLLLHLLFVLRYPVVDQRDFFVPADVLLAVFAGLGFAKLTTVPTFWVRRTIGIALFVSVLATPLVYAVLPDVARRAQWLGVNGRNKPYRDDYVYVFTPWSVVETSAERLSRAAIQRAPSDGVIVVEDRMAEFAVRYQVLRAVRKDLTVLPGESMSAPDGRIRPGHVIYVPLDADQPPPALSGLDWKRDGDLYLLPEPHKP